jgi:hypothetical protein
VTVTVLDVNGNPVPGTATQLSISRQPGGDASLSGNGGATDAGGVVSASLDVGGSGGVIGLSAATDSVSCAAAVVVGEGAVLGAVSLPDTGTGGSGPGDSIGAFFAFLIGAAGVAVVAFAASRRSTRG